MGLLSEEKIIEYTKEGIARTGVTVYQAPFFYRGPMPLTYESGIIRLGSTKLVRWNQFKDFRVEYDTENSKGVRGILAASAVALDSGRKVLARAEVVEIVKGLGFHVQEEHLTPSGVATYSARSYFEFDGNKASEADTKGSKQKEYFFLWPF